MGYYLSAGAGDYYRGGRGDLGGFLKRVGRAGLGFITGGIPGAVGGFLATGTERLPSQPGPGSTTVSIAPPQVGGIKLGPTFEFERTQGVRGSVDFPVSADGACPRGYHLAKDGSGRCVRNRRMNPTNPSALRRAIRREEGFIQLAKRFNLRPPPRQRAGSGLKPKARKR